MQMSNFSIVPKENPIDRAYHKLVLDFSLPHRPQLGQQQWVPTLLLVDFTLRVRGCVNTRQSKNVNSLWPQDPCKYVLNCNTKS